MKMAALSERVAGPGVATVFTSRASAAVSDDRIAGATIPPLAPERLKAPRGILKDRTAQAIFQSFLCPGRLETHEAVSVEQTSTGGSRFPRLRVLRHGKRRNDESRTMGKY
jgi:hypothetical protein